jgi:cytochrome P450
MRDHGDVVRLAVGPPGLRFDLCCVFHPDGVKAVLAGSRAGYSKGTRFYRQIAQSFGWGLLTSEGELWQRQRRLVQPLFTRRQIVAYSELMAEEAAAVAERWERTTRNGGVVDANAEMVRLALRVVGRAIFGDDVAGARDVLDSAFPVLNRRARRAFYGVVDALIAHRQQAGAEGVGCGSGRPGPDNRRRGGARAHCDGDQGGDAPASTGLRGRTAGGTRTGDRRLLDPRRLIRGAQPVRDASTSALLG